MYSLLAYAFIAQDFTTQAALYTHHHYIAGFIMTRPFAHGAIFFIRDYNPEQNEDNVLARMLEHKKACPDHYAFRAGRNLPDKEFRYLIMSKTASARSTEVVKREYRSNRELINLINFI